MFFQPPSSTGHTGNLPYTNKTNQLRKIEYIVVKAKTNNLTWWYCLKIAVFWLATYITGYVFNNS